LSLFVLNLSLFLFQQIEFVLKFSLNTRTQRTKEHSGICGKPDRHRETESAECKTSPFLIMRRNTAYAYCALRGLTRSPEQKRQAKEEREKREIELFKQRRQAGLVDPRRDKAALALMTKQEQQEAATPATQREEQQRRDQEQQQKQSPAPSQAGTGNKETTDKERERKETLDRFRKMGREVERENNSQQRDRGGGGRIRER
jgi:hypothetical protein